jgi:hypothetical protein
MQSQSTIIIKTRDIILFRLCFISTQAMLKFFGTLTNLQRSQYQIEYTPFFFLEELKFRLKMLFRCVFLKF